MCRLGGSPPPSLGEDINEIPPFLSHFSNLDSSKRGGDSMEYLWNSSRDNVKWVV